MLSAARSFRLVCSPIRGPLPGCSTPSSRSILGRSLSAQTGKTCDCSAAAPGTVKDYEHHIFLQVAPSSAQKTSLPGDTWWPQVIERHPAFLQVFQAVAHNRADVEGIVKVTAYEGLGKRSGEELDASICNALVYPAGVGYDAMPTELLPQVVKASVADAALSAGQVQHLEPHVRELKGVQLFVCCHGARDERCGTVGPRLAHALRDLVHAAQLQDSISVYKCSHIGGHKYAGNVLVYGAVHPCDGDWFGGVNPQNVEQFFHALVNQEVGSHGGPADAVLRPFWRGRMGLSPQEQKDLFAAGGITSEGGTDEDVDDDGSVDCEGSESSSSGLESESSDSSSSSSSDDDEPAPVPMTSEQ